MSNKSFLEKLDELIKDEDQAAKEYSRLYQKDKTNYAINGIKTNFLTMSRDERRHYHFIKKLKKKLTGK